MTAPFQEPELDALLDDEPALRERLHDPDAAVRRIALLELAEQEDERWLPWLLRLLRDEAAPVREEAARRLAAWERKESVSALVSALDDADMGVAEAAAQSLAELKNAACGAWVLPALVSPRAFVRARALRALRELRLAASLEPALDLLGDPDAEVRREAIGVVGWLKPAPALPRLAEIVRHDRRPDVRRAAVAALGFVEGFDGEVQAALHAGLKDDDWCVREEAATTLGKLRWADSLPALVEALSDAFWQVALRAARAIGRLGPAGGSAWSTLAGLLDHPLANVRKEAVIALGDLRRIEALAALERAGRDADPDVRKLARLASAAIQGAAVAATSGVAGRPAT
jgi:HEAT repeat protein